MSYCRTLRLVVAASEANPYAKTGGLADVTGALPQELAKLGHDVILIIPRHRSVDIPGRTFRLVARFPVNTPQGMIDTSIEEDVIEVAGSPLGVRVWAIHYDPYFDRPGLYQERGQDYPDNMERFVFFSKAILETMVYLFRERNWKADLLHLHDWQTALCSVYLKSIDQKHTELEGVKTVLTIHNLGYQGLFPGSEFWKTGLHSSLFTLNGLEFFGSVNLLKGGIVFSDYLTTVSPTYSKEILTRDGGFGLDGVLRNRKDQMQGILDGIDVDLWNPQTDPYLPA
ncbi:glycogen synthase, partial [Petrachloros mirabilis]